LCTTLSAPGSTRSPYTTLFRSKFDHFGAYIKPEALGNYEQYLGNEYATAKGLPPRLEITGHLHNRAALNDPKIKEYEVALDPLRSEEHTSELQSRVDLVCRLLL